MLELRPLAEGDIPAALRLSTQAGWNQIEADWRRLLRIAPDRCLGGWVDGRLVATGTLATYGQVLGWVGMILVDEAYRRRGYGTAMLDAVIALGERLGIRALGLDATELGQPLYRKRGFQLAAPINRWGGQAQQRPVSDNCRVAGAGDWPDVFALDREVHGIDRARLLRVIGAEAGVGVRVLRRPDGLAGFGLTRPGRTASHIGPVVARSAHVASRLIDSLLDDVAHAAPDGAALIDIPGNNGLEGIARDRGFAVKRRLVRMFRPRPPADILCANLPHAAAGFELG